MKTDHRLPVRSQVARKHDAGLPQRSGTGPEAGTAGGAASSRSGASSHILSFDGGKSRIVFASLTPRTGRTLAAQWEDVGDQLDVLLAGQGFERSDIVKENIFLRRRRTQSRSRHWLEAYYAGALPATSFICQPPAAGGQLAWEILAIQGPKVRIEKQSEHLTIVRDSDGRWAYVGGIEPWKGAKGTYAQALSCFARMHQQLQQVGFHFNQVVRTWIYERDIVAWEKSGPGAERQRYQILNDARRQFFTYGNAGERFCFPHDLPPASTGIGMSEGAFVMECLALDVPTGSIEITPLKNPEQIDAHAYSQEVLERGAAAIKAAPLFSRGMSIRKDYRMLLISGTASIKGQQTVCLEDPAGQTRTTLENIGLVLAQAQASFRDVQQVRVYIRSSRRKADFVERTKAIQQVVEGALPGIPKLFLQADVCRDNLLVEIEALSFVPVNRPNLKL